MNKAERNYGKMIPLHTFLSLDDVGSSIARHARRALNTFSRPRKGNHNIAILIPSHNAISREVIVGFAATLLKMTSRHKTGA